MINDLTEQEQRFLESVTITPRWLKDDEHHLALSLQKKGLVDVGMGSSETSPPPRNAWLTKAGIGEQQKRTKQS